MNKKLYKAKRLFLNENSIVPRLHRIYEGDIVCWDYKMNRIFNISENFYIPFQMSKQIKLNDTNSFEQL
jgi:hypothetical protein